ncbi:MAG TPA: hypothetical protein VEK33_01415 [Terriglobales bacterium]|nr:hypothetical protein [Terriglobales bacterium]
MIEVSNEPEGFGIRHGAGKGGSKTSDAGELNEAGKIEGGAISAKRGPLFAKLTGA